MTRVEFEAAACLTSVALFEYPQVIKLPGRDIARHADAHARKRIGYASAGMYWKFSAFELSAAAATTPTSSNRRVVRTAPNELFSRQTQPPPSRPPTDSSSEDDDPTPRAVPRFVIRGAPPVAAAAPPPDLRASCWRSRRGRPPLAVEASSCRPRSPRRRLFTTVTDEMHCIPRACGGVFWRFHMLLL